MDLVSLESHDEDEDVTQKLRQRKLPNKYLIHGLLYRLDWTSGRLCNFDDFRGLLLDFVI